MTQSGKHGVFDGIPDNLLKSSNYTFFSTVTVPNGQSIILCDFEEHRSNASQKNDTIWKIRNIPRKIPQNLEKKS